MTDIPTLPAPVATPAPDRGMQNILEVARSAHAALRKSERKVADLVQAEPKNVLRMTLAEAAQRADVSQPTVIRFCVAIGCEGFQDFKLRLAHSLALGTPATHSVLEDSDPPADIVDKIFDYTLTSLDWARTHLDTEAVGRAVDLLEQASCIEFFGFGASGIVAADAQQKFPLFGVPCGAQADSHQQFIAAAMMKPGSVAVVISNTGSTRAVIEIARTARENGAKVIGLTGARTGLAPVCDVTLVVEALDNTNIYTPTISRIAALVVIDILSTAVALRRDEEHRRRFQHMKKRLRDMRSGEPL